MHSVRMTCYIDEYPLLCCAIIKFQPLLFWNCNILKFNVRSCAIQTKRPYFCTPIDDIAWYDKQIRYRFIIGNYLQVEIVLKYISFINYSIVFIYLFITRNLLLLPK